jgi:hypothetical protein
MSEPKVYSFVYDRATADAAFHGIGITELMLSVLAGITPEESWESTLVFEGASPVESPSVCIGTHGPGADQLQLRLLEALERHGIRILEVYEGGPEPRQEIAVARGGSWATP